MSIEIISAGAGSGKTYSLTERMFEILDREETAPHKILALTYMKKAANELRERVSSKLIEKGRPDLALQMQSARIGTVHSICAEFVSQFAFELGESPDLNPIEEDMAETLFEQALDSVFDEKRRDAVLKVVYAMGSPNGVDEFRSSIRQAVKLVRKNRLSYGDLEKSKVDSLNVGQAIFKGGVKILPRLVDAVDGYISRNPTCASTVKKAIDAHELVENASKILKHRSLNLGEMLKLLTIDPGKKAESLFSDILGLASDLSLSEEYKCAVSDYISEYFGILTDVLQCYQSIKVQKGFIDFEDMETKMLQLLDQPLIQQRLQEEIELLLVDEFQDTPPIQLAIFKKLSEICKQVIWVGDVKQSILGFAGADPILMQSLVKEIQSSKDGSVSRLESNWRSHKNLVEFCNIVFSESMKPDGFDSQDVSLKAEKKFESKLDQNFEVWTTDNSRAEDRMKAIAMGISELLGSEISVTDRHTSEVRGIRAGDIAVLLRTNDSCLVLATSLREIGIESSVAVGDILTAPEVALLLAAYSYAIDRRNTVAAAETAMLHSESDEQVEKTLQSIVSKVDANEWATIISKIQSFHGKTGSKSPSYILDEVINELDIIGFCSQLQNSEQRIANVHSIRYLAQCYEQSCFDSLVSASPVGFIRYVEDLPQQELAPSMWSKPQAVNILTMHRSKGLEWPVVILGDINEKGDKGFNIFSNHIVQKEQFNPSSPLEGRLLQFLPWPFGSNKKTPDAFVEAVDKAAQKMPGYNGTQSELRRLLYVAMTRARELMIFSMGKSSDISNSGQLHVLKSESGGYVIACDIKSSVLAVCDKLFDAKFRTFSYNEDVWSELLPAKKTIALKLLEQILDETGVGEKRHSYFISPSELPQDFKVDASKVSKVLSVVQIHDPLAVKDVRHGDDVFGSFFHQVMASTLEGQIDANAIGRLVTSWGFPENIKVPDIVGAIEGFYKWLNAKELKVESIVTELPILLSIATINGERWVRGQIDMVIECDDKILVIDHKTSQISANDTKVHTQKYFDQISLYRTALSHYFQKPIEAWVYYPIVGSCVEVG